MIQFLWTQSFILQSRRFAREISKNLRLLLLRIQFATSRSSTSHPTLLQCVALPGKDKPNNLELARVLIEAGAELNQPLVATASIDYRAVAEVLLDHGAAIDGTGGWSPIEEALYWNSRDVLALLLERGAAVQNLRIAAGLGRTDLIERYFNADGSLKPEAGKINWPWGGLEAIACSNFDKAGRQKLADRVNEWSQDRQGIINNTFVYACMHGHIEAARLLLQHGAEINVVPGGFDYADQGYITPRAITPRDSERWSNSFCSTARAVR